jgi:excisionase family DNA binding protein
MTHSNNAPRTYHRIWPDQPRFLDTLSAGARHARPETITNHLPGPGTAPAPRGNVGGQPPPDVIAHLVIALCRYLRQLREDNGQAPTQLKELTAFLATRVKERQDMPTLDRSCAASDPSAVPRRLLITKREAAEQLGISLRSIERLISAGRLPLVHVEGAARVRVADLGAYVDGLDNGDRTTPSPAEEP